MQAVEARRSENLSREKMEGFREAYERLKADTADVNASMQRQYRTMQVGVWVCCCRVCVSVSTCERVCRRACEWLRVPEASLCKCKHAQTHTDLPMVA